MSHCSELRESCEQVTDCPDTNTRSDAKWAVKTNAADAGSEGQRWSDRVKVFLISGSLQNAVEPETIDTPSLCHCCDWWLESSMQPHWSRPFKAETGRLIIPDNPLWSLDWARAKLTVSLIWPHNKVFFLYSITGAAPWWQFKSSFVFF